MPIAAKVEEATAQENAAQTWAEFTSTISGIAQSKANAHGIKQIAMGKENKNLEEAETS